MSPISRSLRALSLGVAVITASALAAVTPASAGTVSTSSAASAAAFACPTVYWGSLPKVSTVGSADSMTNVRSGQHTCYDRIVIDIAGTGGVAYDVRYVDHVYTEGQSAEVPLAGGAKLQIVVHAPMYDVNTGLPTYSPADPSHLTNVTGYRTLRQIAAAGSFEGQTTIGVGLRAKLPMRAFVLAGPGATKRLVIDLAHQWGNF